MKIDASKITAVLPPTHISAESAYVVASYPYGSGLRCQKRYWLEHNKKGTRLVTQTSNPKKAGLVWNAIKASTYSDIAAFMFLDEVGHVQHHGLSFYADTAECKAFLDVAAAGLPTEVITRVADHHAKRVQYDTIRAEQMATGVDEWPASRIAALVMSGLPLELARTKVLSSK